MKNKRNKAYFSTTWSLLEFYLISTSRTRHSTVPEQEQPSRTWIHYSYETGRCPLFDFWSPVMFWFIFFFHFNIRIETFMRADFMKGKENALLKSFLGNVIPEIASNYRWANFLIFLLKELGLRVVRIQFE